MGLPHIKKQPVTVNDPISAGHQIGFVDIQTDEECLYKACGRQKPCKDPDDCCRSFAF